MASSLILQNEVTNLKMKKTFLILLVLLCVATMAVASVSAASDDAVSDDADTGLTLSDNTIDSISSTDSDASISDSSQDIAASDSGTDDKSVGASPLNDGTTINFKRVSKTASHMVFM